ncbi:MAG TPA: glycosyltransferase [Candidatus Ozemobacteraceae bacterium]|nr:glycosyltransferase [Candidatus Ozemobacteraceae bacterium]
MPTDGDVSSPVPLVSVIIPVYNYGRFLPDAIQSVLNQTHRNLELILIDDGSTDETPAIIQQWLCDSRLRCFRQSRRGMSAARNAGLDAARGAYIQFLDADDILAPDKLRKQLEVLEANPEIFATYCQTSYFSKTPDECLYLMPASPIRNLAHTLFERNVFPIHSILFRRCDTRFDETLSAVEDLDFWIKLAIGKKVFVPFPETLCYVRVHGGNISTKLRRMYTYKIKVMEKYIDDPEYAGVAAYSQFCVAFYIKKHSIARRAFALLGHHSGIHQFRAFLFAVKQFIKLLVPWFVTPYLYGNSSGTHS